ncbi:MAG: spondin domain-containing protein [Pseudomonadota bacterium]
MNSLLRSSLGIALALAASTAAADRLPTFEVTVTNITRGQTFTPILVTTHSPSIALFELGAPASDELEFLAEDGGTGPFVTLLEGAGRAVSDVTAGDGLLAPGQSITFAIEGNPWRDVLSVAAMLIPTNDTFFAIDSVRLPGYGGSRTYFAPGYDAGTEFNDQSCANMPGPRCGGEGLSAAAGEGDEGFVYIGNGFHDRGSVDANGFEVLGPVVYDWRNPVAKVEVKRVRRRR